MSIIQPIIKDVITSPLSSIIPSSGGDVVYDWSLWDGTNDGTVTNIATGGGTGAQDIAMVSDDEAVMLYQNASNGASAVVLDISSKVVQPITTNTGIDLTQGNSTGHNIVKLSDTKFVCLYENTTGSLGTAVLLTKSGKTLTETDVTTSLGLTSGNFRCSLAALNETQAVGFMRDDGDSNIGKLFVIDITGDSITIGTAASVSLDITDYPSVCKAGDNSFFYAVQGGGAEGGSVVGYCTVSGTTITIEDTIKIDASNTVYDDLMLARIDDTTCVCAYELGGSSTVNVNAFQWSGSALSRGTEDTGIFGANDIFQATGTVTDLGNRQAMFSGRLQDTPALEGAAVVVSVDDSLVCTAADHVIIYPSITADHVVCDCAPSRAFVLTCCQDETTTPIQQIGTRVLGI